MSSFTSIEEALKLKNVGKSMKVNGWVKALRLQKVNSFIDVDNGLGGQRLQVVCQNNIVPSEISHHSALKVEGILRKSDHKAQEVELEAENIALADSQCYSLSNFICLSLSYYSLSTKKLKLPYINIVLD